MTDARKKKLLGEMALIVEGLGQELSEDNPNPALLLRLTAAGTMQCLTGVIHLLGGDIEQEPAADSEGEQG